MSGLQDDIEAYDRERDQLELSYSGKWVVFHKGQRVEVFDSFESAAEKAVKLFGRGPYLIRQIGAPPIVLPASVMYRLIHGQSRVRV